MKKSRKESELHTVKLQIKGLESRLRYALSDRDNTARQIEASLFFFYSRIRLYHPPPDRTKVADTSGWMIKPVEPNSSSRCQLYCENNQIR